VIVWSCIRSSALPFSSPFWISCSYSRFASPGTVFAYSPQEAFVLKGSPFQESYSPSPPPNSRPFQVRQLPQKKIGSCFEFGPPLHRSALAVCSCAPSFLPSPIPRYANSFSIFSPWVLKVKFLRCNRNELAVSFHCAGGVPYLTFMMVVTPVS